MRRKIAFKLWLEYFSITTNLDLLSSKSPKVMVVIDTHGKMW